jgi:glyoxylase I family protein
MFAQGIPLAAFEVADIAAEFARLTANGVAFLRPPAPAGPATIAVFADTCGNLIQLYQPVSRA